MSTSEQNGVAPVQDMPPAVPNAGNYHPPQVEDDNNQDGGMPNTADDNMCPPPNGNGGIAPPRTPSPEPARDGNKINIVVKDQHESQIHFTIKRTTSMAKVMTAYASRQGLNEKSIRFMVDGVRVLPEHTPDALDLNDGDMIDVYQQQLGGSL